MDDDLSGKEKILKKFSELTHFQQWLLMYINENPNKFSTVDTGIPDLCDETKTCLDIDNYDAEIADYEKQLNELEELQLIKNTSKSAIFKSVHPLIQTPPSFILTGRGKLYLFQQVEHPLKKINYSKFESKIDKSFTTSTDKSIIENIKEKIIDSGKLFKYVIETSESSMTILKIISKILLIISNANS